jgi:hypothetical protein
MVCARSQMKAKPHLSSSLEDGGEPQLTLVATKWEVYTELILTAL